MYKKYTKEFLEPFVKQSKCVSDVCRLIGLPAYGRQHTHISNQIKKYEIDITHFIPYYKTERSPKKHWSHFLTLSSKIQQRHVLLRSMRECGIPYVCTKCNSVDRWQNETLVLEIDHINEDRYDNRPENLQFLCPNCHSQKTIKKLRKYVLQQDFLIAHKQQAIENNKGNIEKIVLSNIDFSKKGCMKQAANLINKNPAKIKKWFLKYMPDFYNRCIVKGSVV